MQLKGSIRRSDALKIADRLSSHLRSHDQASEAPSPRVQPRSEASERWTRRKRSQKSTTIVKAEQWVAVRESSEIKLKIGAIASLLDSIIQQIRHSNAPPGDQILTDLERQQLIAILETALNVLRSPMVESGLLRRTIKMLRKASGSAAEKGVQQGLGMLMESAGSRIAELVASIFR